MTASWQASKDLSPKLAGLGSGEETHEPCDNLAKA